MCRDGNATYREGQTFTPAGDRCATCVCKPGFDPAASPGDPEFCYRPNCFVRADERMQRGCVPVFHRDDCCPWEWVCPRAGGGVTDDLGEVAGPGEVPPFDLLILFCVFHS